MSTLSSFPEELLSRILALVLPARAPLLVSRQFLRIASPLFYHSLLFHSPHQLARAIDTLARHPALANAVRAVALGGIWHDSATLLALCVHVQDVDICLDSGPTDADAEAFCRALEQRHTITHLTIRKNPATYLTHPRPAYVLQRLAQAVQHWSNLESVHLAFRIPCSPTTLPLARALSAAPRLRCVRAQVPAVWNNLLLLVSANPSLERVMLYTEPILGPIQTRQTPIAGSTVIKERHACDDTEHAVLGTGLYMMEAKKHARLSDLIKSGTSIIRTRAHTTIVTLSTSPASATPLGAIRAKELVDELMSSCDNVSFARHAHVHA